MWNFLLIALGVSLAINIAMFLVAFRLKTDKLTDISYAVTFVVLATLGLLAGAGTTVQLLLFAMVLAWAARLGGFLLIRIRKTGKDSRFDAMRNSFWRFGKFWIGQGITVWMVMLASLLALHLQTTQTNWLTWVGFVIWAIGLAIEAAADLQKYRFTSNPMRKNQWIDTGLWHYSRHPNYLGEIMVWAGVFLFATPMLSGAQTLIAAASPLFIAILLLFVSGIPILEKSADTRWGDQREYREYKRRTSILLLWPPHKN